MRGLPKNLEENEIKDRDAYRTQIVYCLVWVSAIYCCPFSSAAEGRSTVGHASSPAPGSSGCAHGFAAVPHHGVDVQRQNTRRAHQQTEG